MRKIKFGLPQYVVGMFKCPNDVCITNREPEAQPKFRVVIQGGETYFECLYCGVFSSQQEVTGLQPANNV